MAVRMLSTVLRMPTAVIVLSSRSSLSSCSSHVFITLRNVSVKCCSISAAKVDISSS